MIKTSGAPGVRILDLPGDNPANMEEQKHVNQMAKTYLPFADLVLLIGRGDDLSFLQPQVITLPGIEDWQAMPHRFRIVTTYSYSAQSVKTLIRNDPAFDIAQLRQRLIEQIERFSNLSDAAKDRNLYFPLEFGSSWLSMAENDTALYARVAPMVSRLRSELLEQIATSTSPLGRLRSTLDTHLSVKYIQEEKTAAIEKELLGLKKQQQETKDKLTVWKNAITQTQQKLKKTERLLKDNALPVSRRLIDKAAEEAAKFKLKGSYSSEKCSTLHSMIADYCFKIKDIQLDVKIRRSTGKKWPATKLNLRDRRFRIFLMKNSVLFAIGSMTIGSTPILVLRIIYRIKTASSMPLIMPKWKSFGCGLHNGWLPQRTSIINTKANSPKRG